MDNPWARYKVIIKQYWIVENMQLEQVAGIMREKHGFDKKPKTYETKFREWGNEFRKKKTAALWKVMGAKVKKREKQGKKTDIYVHGTLIPKSKLCKEIARYSYESGLDRYRPAPSPEAPDEVMICTPPSLPDLSYIWNDLPWLRFQGAFQSLVSTELGLDFLTVTEDGSICAKFLRLATQTYGFQMEARLRSMLLPSHPCWEIPRMEIGGVGANSQMNFFNIAMYLISNSSPRLEDRVYENRRLVPRNSLDFPYEVLACLEDRMHRTLLLSLIRMKTTTTRMLVQKLCEYAIRTDKTGLLHLFNADIILDAWKNKSYYPVLIATLFRQKGLAMRLVQAGADLSGVPGIRVLIQATQEGYSELVQRLVQKGIDVNSQLPVSGQTALFVAVAHGNFNLVQILIKLGANVNLQSTTGTALRLAVMRNEFDLVRLLIANGASLDALGRSGPEPSLIQRVVQRERVHLLRLLVDAGVDLDDFDIPDLLGTPLQAASRSGNKQMVKLLLDHGAIVNAPALVKGGLLKAAVETGNFETVNILVRAGVAVNPPLLEHSGSCLKAHGTALNEAVKKNDIELAQLLLEHGADPNAPSHAGQYRQTDLYAAVCQGSVQFTQLLLSAGARVNDANEYLSESRGWYEETALHAAVQRSNLQLVQILLQAGANIGIPAIFSGKNGDYQATTLEIAAEHPSSDIVRLLLTANSTMTPESKAYALQAAVDLGDLELIHLLLAAGADVNAPPLKGVRGTLLQESIHKRNHQTTVFLLSVGATINTPGAGIRGTALQEAISVGDIYTTKLLLAAGADANAPAIGHHSKTALQQAVEQGSLYLSQLVLEAGADVDGGRSGKPLRTAAARGDAEAVELLLRFNAAVNPPSIQGRTYLTPLQVAAKAGSTSIVTRLLEKGADIDAGIEDKRGTALQKAAKQGHLHVVEVLLESGANIDTISEAGTYRTALHEATMGSHQELVRFLLNRRADPNIPASIFLKTDKYWVQETALQSAIDNGSLELARLLVEAGARADVLTAEDQERRTPLEAAMDTNDDDTVNLVLEAGADVNLPGCYKLGFAYQPWWSMEPAEAEKTDSNPSALLAAVSWQSVRKVQLLLDAQADVNTSAEIISWLGVIKGQMTPLQAAVATSNGEIIRLLLDAGANARINTQFPYYQSQLGIDLCSGSLLAVAILKSDARIVQLLIQHSAAINVPAKGNLGRTALQAAVDQGNIELVEQLLELGADVNAPPSEKAGATAFQLAAIHGYAGIASILLDAGADPYADCAKEGGRSALEGAAEHGRTDLVHLLLNAGEALGLPGSRYAKALELAATDVIADMITAAIESADNADGSRMLIDSEISHLKNFWSL